MIAKMRTGGSFVNSIARRANITYMISRIIHTICDRFFANIAEVIAVCVLALGCRSSTDFANMIVIIIYAVADLNLANITEIVFV